MTHASRPARYRLLAAFQALIVAGSLLAPVSAVAEEPSPNVPASPATSDPTTPPATDPPAAEPTAAPEAQPTAKPTEAPSVEPAPSATPEPTEAPTVDPAPPADPEPTVAPADPADSPTPSVAPADSTDFVVTFAPGTNASERAQILAGAGAQVVDSVGPLRIAVIRVPAASDIVAELRARDDVLHVERDRVREAEATPNDPGYDSQWSLRRIGWDDLYGTIDPKGSAVVAVLDTGVDAGHADLAGRLVAGTTQLPGSDPTSDPNGHGTAMAGIIAAGTDNGTGIAGIGFDRVKVMPVTVLDADGLGQDSDIIEGIVWAVDHGADVINLSFSNPGFSSALQAAVDYAWDHDVVVVAATGNDGSGAPTYPAGDRGVVGVSNTNRADELNASSNHGADTFLAAPGTDIDTLAAGGGTTSVTGTSASSAEVASAAALLRAIDPGASNGTIVGRLARSAAAVGTRAETGNGRLDLARAVADRGDAPVKPDGAAPSGDGGPFVGPYVAANATVNAAGTTLNGTTGSVSVLPGASITLVMNVTTSLTGLLFNWDSSRWALATSTPAAAAMSCVDHADHSGLGTYSETFTITAPATPGTYNLYLIAYNGACGSGAGPTFTRAGAVVVDNTAPTVTINQAATQLDPSNASTVNFTVVFSESTTTFATGDVTITGTSGGTKTGTVTGSGTTYNVAVTGMTSSGTVVATIGAGVATDAAGNANVASTSTDNTVTWDNVAPTVTINQAVGQPDPTNTSPINFTVVFSEPTTNFVTGDVSFTGSTSGGGKTGTVTGSGTTYNVAVTGMTSSGTVVATIATGAATDAAGNANIASTSTDNVVAWDNTPPAVTINQAVGQPDPTNTSPINFTVVFSEAVTGFATGDVTIAGSSGGVKIGTVSGSGTTYNVAVTGMGSSGTVTASIPAGVAFDAAGNGNVIATSSDAAVTWNIVPPSVTINQAATQTDPTNALTINFTVVFNSIVTGFTTGDVSLAGTAGGTLVGTVTGSGTTYNVAVTGMSSSGTVVATVGAGVAVDTAGNPNLASTSTDNSVTWDNVAPTVTINQAVAQADPTNTSPINFTVVFSEPTTNFVTGDVTFSGTSGGTKVGAVTGSGTTYNVAVTGMTGSGTVIATITAGKATDAAGNANLASTSTDNTVTWDVTPPTVTINQTVGQPDPTNTSPINFTVTFNEAVTNFATGDVSFAGTAGGAKTGTVTGGPTVYNVAVTGMTTSGTVIATVAASVATDLAGNNNAASTSTDNTVTWDVIAPTVTINQAAAQADPTNAATINFSVVFSESTTNFATGDVSLAGTAGGPLVGTVSGSGTTYNVAVTGMSSSGTVIATIAAGAATDAAGNGNAASTSTDNSVTWDNVAPTVTINQALAQADPTNTSPINFTVVFSESVANFVTGDVTFAGTAGGTKTGAVTGSGTTYNVAVTGMTGSGTVIATITAGKATDAAGNNNAPSTSTDNTVTWDVTAPTVTINQAGAQPDPTNASPINFTVTFSEPVTGFVTGDVTIAGTAGGTKTGTVTGGPTIYNVAVTGMTISGTVIATITANKATDLAGNNNAASTSTDNTVVWNRATHLGFAQQPTDTVYRSTITPAVTVAVLDDNGLVVTESAASITLALAPAGPTLGGTLTHAAVSGVATFGGLTVNQVGTYTLNASATGLLPATSTTFQVTPAPLTVTANNRTKVYGQTVTFAGTEFTTSGLLGTDAVTAVTLTSAGAAPTATVAGSQYPITPSAAVGTGLGNYAISYLNGALTVTPATLTITANDRTKVYGQTVVFAGTEFVASGLLNADTATSVTLTSPGAAPTATVSGSPYPITPSAAVGTGLANYTISYVAGVLTVTPATLTITADDRTKTYGQTVTFAGTEFTSTGLQNADTVASVTLNSAGAAPTATVAGSPYPITPSAAVGTGLANYAIAYVAGELAVDPAALAITADDVTKTYGDTVTFTGTEFTTSGLQNADTVASVTLASAGAAPTAAVAGSPYPIVASAATGTGLGNYTITYVDGELTVDPASLTITAVDATKVYGTTAILDGTEFVAIGLLNSDLVDSVTVVSPGTPASATVAGSPYPITPSAAVGTGLDNYTITYVDGLLFVTPADLTITADDTTKTYGDTVTFAGTEFTSAGLQNADAVESVTLNSAGAVPTASVAGSPYPITPSAAIGTGLDNYAITYVPGSLTVTKADAVIVVTGYSVTYDALPHTATGTATGVLGEDLAADLDLSATTHTDVGAYTDAWTFTDPDGNYNDAAGTVDSEITPADLTITADDATKTYGDTVTFAGTEFTTVGLLGSDGVDSVTLTSAGAAATATVVGSPYAIVASSAVGTGLANYTITYVDGLLTVDPAALTITADDQAKPFGVAFAFAGTELSTTGLVNGDSVSSATLTSAGAAPLAAPGTYPISISAAVGTGLASYTITYVPGTFTVGNTPPAIGDAAVTTEATASVSGAVTVTDPDTGQTVTLAITTAPVHGTVTLAQDGSFTYQPIGTYTGQDGFAIEGCDDAFVSACDTGTVTVSIYPVAVPDAQVTSQGETIEVDVQANDIGDAGAPVIVSGPSHGTARIGSIIYTPDAGFAGTDEVVYRVCSPNDQTLCDDATLTITVASDAPPTDSVSLGTPLGPVRAGYAQLAAMVALFVLASLAAAFVIDRRRATPRAGD